jgi:hypothetical protein
MTLDNLSKVTHMVHVFVQLFVLNTPHNRLASSNILLLIVLVNPSAHGRVWRRDEPERNYNKLGVRGVGPGRLAVSITFYLLRSLSEEKRTVCNWR